MSLMCMSQGNRRNFMAISTAKPCNITVDSGKQGCSGWSECQRDLQTGGMQCNGRYWSSCLYQRCQAPWLLSMTPAAPPSCRTSAPYTSISVTAYLWTSWLSQCV